MNARPWYARLLALTGGLAAAVAHPPWGLLPGLLGYGLMFVAIDRSDRPREAFLRGWLGGVGYFLVSLWWIYEPFQVDAENQGWMAPIAVGVMVSGMALFWGTVGLVYRLLAGSGVRRLVFYVGLMAGCEWLRGHILTGFPWNLPGESWRAGSPPSQFAAVVGAYGLTWITLALACGPWLVREGRRGWAVATASALAVAGLWAFGLWRLDAPQTPRTRPPLVRIVQANIDQKSKYDRRAFNDIVRKYLTLTARVDGPVPDVVVWPEGAVPAALDDYLAPGTWTEQAIGNALRPGQVLITGGFRYGAPKDGKDVYFNSLAVARDGADGPRVLAVYDKYRLVPFGEFLPFEDLTARLGIKQMVHVGDGFTPGPPPDPMIMPGLPAMQPLICYESLFPGFARDGSRRTGRRAAWIINISNDAWFGTTSGPLQHLNIASYRAIEEGLPMVRATPTGVSAVVDAFGRVLPGKSLGQGAFGVIDAPLPPALAPTLYDRWGEWPFAIMLLASLAGVGWKEGGRPAPLPK